MKVIVVGAGIGGSALAVSLQQLGIDHVVVEQAPALTGVGAGIQLSPNGVRILDRLGFGDALGGFCTEPDFHKYSVWDSGETILRTALMPRVRETYGHPYYHAHRADLVALLTGSLDAECLQLESEVVDVGQTADSAWVTCADGRRIEGDVVIGADGIHSLVRERIFNPGPPRASGYVAWRGVVDASAVASLEIPVSAYVDMGPRLSFVYYFVSGGARLNWIALGQEEEGQAGDRKRESWSQTATKAEVIAGFGGWYDRPKQIIEATEQPFVTALYDRDPLDSWVNGRIALMGDAAHAMLPYHAQGAVQSIEDAWVLARTLSLVDPLVDGRTLSGADEALQRFELLRRDRANQLVQQSRNAERWYHVEDASEVEARNARFRRNNDRFGDDFSPQQHWLYSYDAELAALGTDDAWRDLPAWS